jgi:hypothetical protein
LNFIRLIYCICMQQYNIMNSKDIIMLVIASRGNIYDELITIYWIPFIKFINKNKLNIKVFLLFSEDSKTDDLSDIIKPNLLIHNNKESLIPGILEKTIYGFKYIDNTFDYNYIIRTNLSTFYIVNNLLKISTELNKRNLYAGFIGMHGDIKFCSGACFWISKDIVKYCIKNQKSLDFNLPDDVAIGKFLNKFQLLNLKRYDIINNINIQNKSDLLKNIIDKNFYNIRIKNHNREIDLLYFKAFTDQLYN